MIGGEFDGNQKKSDSGNENETVAKRDGGRREKVEVREGGRYLSLMSFLPPAVLISLRVTLYHSSSLVIPKLSETYKAYDRQKRGEREGDEGNGKERTLN